MPRFKTSRSHSKPSSRGGSRARASPKNTSEGTPKDRFIARARARAARSEARNERRSPSADLRMAVLGAMEKYGLESRFSLVENAKANSLDERVVERVGESVRDLRYLLWSSIGDYGAAGLDQVEYCERGQGGEILVKVAIADLDAFVPKGSTLDLRAQTNATSVYAGAEAFPMLPEKLPYDLSSFPMGRDRLAIVVEFAVLLRGNVRPGKIYRATVKNRAQLSYGEVGAWLDGKFQTPEMMDEIPGLEAQIRLQEEASSRLGKYRQNAPDDGAKESKTLGLCAVEEDSAKSIIGNFMFGASGAMLGYLEGMNIPAIRRVVAEPKDWAGIAGIANERGFALPAVPDAPMLAEFLKKEKAANPGKFPALSSAIAKLLGPGEYAMFDRRNPIECFCMAVSDYSIGTAPNQRYMDLIIQRLLKAAVAQTATPYTRAELTEFAVWCTERENAARKAERAVSFHSGPAV